MSPAAASCLWKKTHQLGAAKIICCVEPVGVARFGRAETLAPATTFVDRRANRRETVKALGAGPLAFTALDVATPMSCAAVAKCIGWPPVGTHCESVDQSQWSSGIVTVTWEWQIILPPSGSSEVGAFSQKSGCVGGLRLDSRAIRVVAQQLFEGRTASAYPAWKLLAWHMRDSTSPLSL